MDLRAPGDVEAERRSIPDAVEGFGQALTVGALRGLRRLVQQTTLHSSSSGPPGGHGALRLARCYRAAVIS